jgi:DNA invertase Pin-like site-specific DNA recombinase
MDCRNFVAYYRVSTAKQGASGLGLEAQQEAVARFTQGAGLLGAYTDIESGTRKGNFRPELAKAIAHAKRAKATLVIAKLDRLARNVAFVSNLMEAGVDFVAADNPTANRLTIHILAAVAEAEAEAISRRTKEALAAAKARGKVLGNPANLTQEAQAKGAEATRKKAQMHYAGVTPLVARLKAQGLSFAAIAARLNAEGVTTSQGNAFLPNTVKRIIDRSART